jgi:hypothetical protein
MPKTLPRPKPEDAAQYVLLGSTKKFHKPLPAGVKICRAADLNQFVHHASTKVVFISCRRASTDALLKASLQGGARSRFAQLLAIESPRAESVPSLLGVFGAVLGLGADNRWLPVEELVTVLSGNDAANRFIGGAVDAETETVALVRGNRETMVLPFSFFEPAGDGVKPDFSKLSSTDYGRTVAFGEYEASADGILYETDPGYRSKLNKERRESERSFGASLRRLRLQRKLQRGDFAPLTSKTIARIERSEVGKPHGRTLQTLAERLGVSADQIESY